MNLTYKMLMDSTMTLKQCGDRFDSDLAVMGGMFLIGIVVFGILAIYLIIQNRKMARFIKDEKIQEKFQKHKEMNKGLD